MYKEMGDLVREAAWRHTGCCLSEQGKSLVESPACMGGGGLHVPGDLVADAHFVASYTWASKAVPKIASALGRPLKGPVVGHEEASAASGWSVRECGSRRTVGSR